MSLIPVFELQVLEGKKLQKNPYVHEAIRRLQKENNFTEEENEDVIELPDLILKMYELLDEQNNYRGNKNAVK